MGTGGIARNFTETAEDYDQAVLHNIEGARRLIGAIPDGDYDSVLDVGCGTGHASLAMARRFPVTRITGVDPAGGMLEVFRAKVQGVPDLEVTLYEADVLEMPVREGEFDVVISSMAFHWFPRKSEATKAMARALRPGGVMAIMCSGRKAETEFKRVLSQVEPPVPAAWIGTFDAVQRDQREMEQYLLGAGMEPIDIWMEERIRRQTPEAYLERMRVVAGHLNAGMDPAVLEELQRKIYEATLAACGPDGLFEYTFTKLHALARKPE